MSTTTQANTIKKRFERDAVAFNAIYDTRSEFSGWFNKTFRQPIFERYALAFEALGDVSDKTILDVGCGSGVYSTEFAIKGARKVTGIDFSGPMLEIAKKRALTNQVTDKCQFIQEDFMNLAETAENKHDFAIAMGVFDYLPDPQPFLNKLKRMTNQRIAISFPGYSLFRAPLRKVRYWLSAKGNVYFYTKKQIETLAINAHFKKFEVRPMQLVVGLCS